MHYNAGEIVIAAQAERFHILLHISPQRSLSVCHT